jgi:hypothetical protein
MPSRIVQVPWEPGLTGKGIYWPEANKLETWADPRHHVDVYGEGDYGQAHCLGIDSKGNCWHEGDLSDEDWENPNAMPLDQLARSLHHLDPRLTPRRMNPEYDWDFNASAAKHSHQLGWMPGAYGKGLIHDGEVHTWPTSGDDGEPSHPEYASEHLALPEGEDAYIHSPTWDTAFQIDPQGRVNVFEPEKADEIGQQIESADPNLKVNYNHDYAWNFGPTEPMKTTPDSEDEKRLHNVEISNDWEVPTVDA